VSKTKYCCSLKVKIFGHSENFGLATLSYIWFVNPTLPEPKSTVLLKLCMKLANFSLKLFNVPTKQLA